jgi:hypothetical protein
MHRLTLTAPTLNGGAAESVLQTVVIDTVLAVSQLTCGQVMESSPGALPQFVVSHNVTFTEPLTLSGIKLLQVSVIFLSVGLA